MQNQQPLGFSVVVLVGMPMMPGKEKQHEVEVRLPENIREVLMSIFGDPIRTTIGISSKGFVASLPDTPIRFAEIGFGRIQAQTPVAIDTARVVATLCKAVFSVNPTFKIAAYGLNYEFEFALRDVGDSGKWLAERFIAKKLRVPGSWEIKKGEIGVSLDHVEGAQRNINIQPRPGMLNLFVAKVNNHVSVPGDIDALDQKTWAGELEREYRATSAFVSDLLLQPTRGRRKA